MDRRNSIKSILLGTVAGGLVVHGCKPEAASTEELAAVKSDGNHFVRSTEEKELI